MIKIKKTIKNDTDDETTTESIDESIDKSIDKKDNYTIRDLCELLTYEYFDDYDKWISLGFIIHNEYDGSSEGFKLYDEISQKSSKYDYDTVFKQYNNNTKKKTKNEKSLKIGTLKFWIKKIKGDDFFIKKIQFDDVKEVSDLMDEVIKNKTHNDIAKLFNKLYGHKFKKVGEKEYYYFNDNNLWEQDYEGTIIRNFMSNDLYNKFKPTYDNYKKMSLNNDLPEDEKEDYKQRAENINFLLNNLKNNIFKNSVLREINDLIKDLKFIDDMNKEKFIIPIKNKKVFNIETLKIEDRTEKHKFNYCCNVDFINDFNKDGVNEKTVIQYFNELFINDEELHTEFLNIIKTSMTGEMLKNIFVLVGDGNNGKSLLFKILNKIFDKSMKTLCNDIIIDSKNKNQINSEYDKLDKCRIGYISEVSENDTFNIPLVKKITGDDTIDYRPLYKENRDLKPTSNLFVLTNELPKLGNKKDGNIDQAFINRLCVIRLKNNFAVDNTFEKKMINILDYIFTYIMMYGKIVEKIILCPSMIEEVEEYILDNTRNYLKEFINDTYNRVEIIEQEDEEGNLCYEKGWSKKSILKNRFMDQWKEYCIDKKIKYIKETDTKFTRDLKKLHKIDSIESNHKVYYIGLEEKEKREEEEIKIIVKKK
jgi:phage/plasmid-associated DNA primase